MKGVTRTCLCLLLSMLATSAGAQEDAVHLMVYVEPSGIAKGAVISSGSDEVSVVLAADAVSGPLEVMPTGIDDLPLNLTIEWGDQTTTSLPAFVFAAYSGKKIPVRVHRFNFALADSAKADNLCWHTQPSDVRSAFKALFGCQEWVKLIEASDEKWTKSHLRGLRGWFAGSYYLFTKVKPVKGLGLSPWGMQPELVDRLREILAEIDEGRAEQREFEPFLRIADIRNALTELDRWELRLYGLIPQMLEAGNLAGAKTVNDRVAAAYDRYAGPLATEAIDGVNRKTLEQTALLIEQRLSSQ